MSDIVNDGVIHEKTLEKLSQLFNSSQKILPVITDEVGLRLRKINENSILLEEGIIYELTSQSMGDNEFEKIVTLKFSYQTVALYKKSGNIFVPLEIENLCKKHIDFNEEFLGHTFRSFSLLENAVIAAFSMQTYKRAILKQDFKYMANDLSLDIIMTFNNEPQIWLDDKYGITHPIAMYFPNGGQTVNSMIQTKEVFDRLLSMDILEIFKKERYY